ncbi:MAG: spore protease YyaC [Methanomassiliicoccales archaeon]
MKLRPSFGPDDNEATYHYKEPHCSIKLQGVFSSLLTRFDPEEDRDIIVLCIGTDRSTGDALGPLTGTRLRGLGLPDSCVYGTLDDPVHATNLSEVLTMIRSHYENPLVIPVDACLGKIDRVGNLNIRCGTLSPGTAVKKDLPAVGEFHISGNVNVSGFLEHMVLQNTRLSLVMSMADVVSRAIFFALYQRTNPNLRHLEPPLFYPTGHLNNVSLQP